MKKAFSIACVCLLLILSACDKDNANNTTPDQGTGGTLASCAEGHTWAIATCSAPKTCTKCGITEGVALEHNYKEATCTAPKTCSACGATEGDPLEHSWTAATCSTPQTCTECGITEGVALEHNYKEATCTAPKTCSACGATEGSAAGHKWVAATYTKPKTCSRCKTTVGTALPKPAPASCIGKTVSYAISIFGTKYESYTFEGSEVLDYDGFCFFRNLYGNTTEITGVLSSSNRIVVGKLHGHMTYKEIVAAVGPGVSLGQPNYWYNMHDDTWEWSLNFNYGGYGVNYTWYKDPATHPCLSVYVYLPS